MSYLVSAVVASLTSWTGIYLSSGSNNIRLNDPFVPMLIFVLGTMFIIVGAALPFLASRVLAKRFRITSPYYEGTCGGLTGVLLGPSSLVILPDFATTGVPAVPFRDAYVASLTITGPWFLLGGVAGGVVYWITSNWLSAR